MRLILFIITLCFSFSFKAKSQLNDTLPTPRVQVTVSLSKDTFKLGDDIQLTMTLLNKTKQIQSVWFDKPKSGTGGPALTSVVLTNKATGKSVLKYQNKAILESRVHTTEQIKAFSYQLEPEQGIKKRFDLYDMIVTDTEDHKLKKGIYKMQVFYNMNPSNIITFTVN